LEEEEEEVGGERKAVSRDQKKGCKIDDGAACAADRVGLMSDATDFPSLCSFSLLSWKRRDIGPSTLHPLMSLFIASHTHTHRSDEQEAYLHRNTTRGLE